MWEKIDKSKKEFSCFNTNKKKKAIEETFSTHVFCLECILIETSQRIVLQQ